MLLLSLLNTPNQLTYQRCWRIMGVRVVSEQCRMRWMGRWTLMAKWAAAVVVIAVVAMVAMRIAAAAAAMVTMAIAMVMEVEAVQQTTG